MNSNFIKDLGKNILVYGLGNFSYSLVQLITMPIVLHALPKNDIAGWNILLLLGTIVIAICTFGMDAATGRFWADEKDGDKKVVIFSTAFYFNIFISLLFATIMLLATSSIASKLNLLQNHINAYYLLLLWIPCIIINQFFQNWYKCTFQKTIFTFTLILQSSIYLFGLLYLKFTQSLSLYSVLMVLLLSQVGVILLGIYSAKKMFTLKLSMPLLKKMIAYGLPFLVFAFGYNFLMGMDRFFLKKIPGDEQYFAVYSTAVRITAIMSMVLSAFNFAFGGFSLAIINTEDAGKRFGIIQSIFLIFMTYAGVCFLALQQPIIIVLAGKSYLSSLTFFPSLVASSILYGLYSFAQLGIIKSKKSYLGVVVLFTSIAICYALNFLFINTFKGIATSNALLVANGCMCIGAYFFSHKYLKIKHDFKFYITLVVLFVLLSIFFKTNLSPIIYLDSFIKIIISTTIFIAVFFKRLEKIYIYSKEYI